MSKKVLGLVCGGKRIAMSIAKQEKKKAERVEKVTRTSIVAVPCRNDFIAGRKKSRPMPNCGGIVRAKVSTSHRYNPGNSEKSRIRRAHSKCPRTIDRRNTGRA